MAGGSVTTTGLQEMRAAIQKFPDAVTAKLRSVAWRTSRTVMERAKAKFRADTKRSESPYTADAIHIIEEPDRKRFIVISVAPQGEWPMLPAGREFGTVRQPARPYMQPAADAARESYQHEMAAAAEQVARETFE